jgi:hypothetical protein
MLEARKGSMPLAAGDRRTASAPVEPAEIAANSRVVTSVTDLIFTPDGTLVVARTYQFGERAELEKYLRVGNFLDLIRARMLRDFGQALQP